MNVVHNSYALATTKADLDFVDKRWENPITILYDALPVPLQELSVCGPRERSREDSASLRLPRSLHVQFLRAVFRFPK